MAIKKLISLKNKILNLKKKQNGFALIFVLVFVAMIMGVVGDIVYQTQVGARGSIEERNGLDAQATALTGIEFAKIMLSLSILSEKYQGNPLVPIPKNLYNLLNGQPIGSSGLEKLEELSGANISKAIAPGIQQALKVIPGYFVLNISSENSKLNLNLLQSTYSADTQKALLRIFSTPDSQKFIESMGYTPQQLVDNLTSYIKISSTNNAAAGAYDNIGAKYKAKNGGLESLEELRRIPGFHLDDIYNMYSPYFTIWPIVPKKGNLNINNVPVELVAALLTQNGQEVNNQEMDTFENFREKPIIKESPKDWFAKNLPATKDNPDTVKIIELLFGNTDTIYRVESRGVVNGVEKTLVVILQQGDFSSKGNDNKGTDNKDNDNKGNDNKGTDNKDKDNKGNDNKGNDNKGTDNKGNDNKKTNSTPSFNVIYSMWK
ncbi:hypothetical protein GCL60_04400 [Silvanigrella paludirubra]|uniref:T2SS protein K first SAM-like domain-containing protein n=1 Tax=Silvanigrella paludirubra TaxID=2499159 RepID=A0A6N6VT50_9BACT|nr:type II secretion system protein GspK [Silvanigrella paludirubra]KAB8039500.1 hypothetical protein GCL60_04400 [Silvanigrella paludirubra]